MKIYQNSTDAEICKLIYCINQPIALIKYDLIALIKYDLINAIGWLIKYDLIALIKYDLIAS